MDSQNQLPKKKGGRRPGAGRKRDPLKDLRTGALTAQRILKEIDDAKQIPELYKLLTPAQKLSTIFKLRDCAYGRPAVADEQPQQKTPVTIDVRIHRVGA